MSLFYGQLFNTFLYPAMNKSVWLHILPYWIQHKTQNDDSFVTYLSLFFCVDILLRAIADIGGRHYSALLVKNKKLFRVPTTISESLRWRRLAKTKQAHLTSFNMYSHSPSNLHPPKLPWQYMGAFCCTISHSLGFGLLNRTNPTFHA